MSNVISVSDCFIINFNVCAQDTDQYFTFHRENNRQTEGIWCHGR